MNSKKARPAVAAAMAFALLAAACAGDDSPASELAEPTTAAASAVTTTVASATTGAPETTTVAPQSLLAADGSAIPIYGGTDLPNEEPYDSTFFENYGVNPRIDTEDDRFSTFALDVDTGSYTVGRRFLSDGNLPDKDSVRLEEYVNYFDQGYGAPSEDAFAIHVDGGPTPFVENDRYVMLRVGLRSRIVPDADRKPAHLTFVIDISGSMERENRLEAVKDSLRLLVEHLRPSDTIGIVVYGSNGRVVLEPTAVADSRRILAKIDGLAPGGSTNAEEGLVLGYNIARDSFEEGAINRVILASDGVANVGATAPKRSSTRSRTRLPTASNSSRLALAWGTTTTFSWSNSPTTATVCTHMWTTSGRPSVCSSTT